MSPKDFFSKYENFAIESQELYGVPASITLAQAALESGWGESGLTKNANNFFGVKCGSKWTGKKYSAKTQEFYNGIETTITDCFRAYDSPYHSFNDHAQIYAVKKAKQIANGSIDYKTWAKALKQAGYATAPDYDTVLIQIIEKHKLNLLDTKAGQKKNS